MNASFMKTMKKKNSECYYNFSDLFAYFHKKTAYFKIEAVISELFKILMHSNNFLAFEEMYSIFTVFITIPEYMNMFHMYYKRSMH